MSFVEGGGGREKRDEIQQFELIVALSILLFSQILKTPRVEDPVSEVLESVSDLM